MKSEAAAVVEEFISLVGQNRLDDANALFLPAPTPTGTVPPGGVVEALPSRANEAQLFRAMKLTLAKVVSEETKGDSSSVVVALNREADQTAPDNYTFGLKKLNGKWMIEKYSASKP